MATGGDYYLSGYITTDKDGAKILWAKEAPKRGKTGWLGIDHCGIIPEDFYPYIPEEARKQTFDDGPVAVEFGFLIFEMHKGK